MHVRGFTKSPTSGVEQPRDVPRASIEKIPYLQELGRHRGRAAAGLRVRRGRDQRHQPDDRPEADQLLGLQPDQLLQRRTRATASRPTRARHVREFRDMVKALHKAGIEVILDVVFNHTGEGNHEGPTISFRGLDNSVYYHLEPYDKQFYTNFSGCGNTVNCNHPLVEKFIAECLLFWVREMHVDGFRFDLALDPVARPGRQPDGRPAGPLAHRARRRAGRHQDHRRGVGRRRAVPGRLLPGLPLGRVERPLPRRRPALRQGRRRAWSARSPRGSRGSADIYQARRRAADQQHQLHHRHDGFTLNDLVSYNGKHNEANGEGNRDGTDDNLSWNCGVEGDTDDPAIEALRARQVRNFLTILMLSQGVPMMVMGDEARQTQFGNNNAYCQDNEITWFDWTPGRAARRPRPVHQRADRVPQGAPDAPPRHVLHRRGQRARADRHRVARLHLVQPGLGRPGVAGPRLHARRLPDAGDRQVEPDRYRHPRDDEHGLARPGLRRPDGRGPALASGHRHGGRGAARHLQPGSRAGPSRAARTGSGTAASWCSSPSHSRGGPRPAATCRGGSSWR